MTKSANDKRSPGPLRRKAFWGSFREVEPFDSVNWLGNDRAWNQNFTNPGNEGNQNANNKTNTNKSVRPVRSLSPGNVDLTLEDVITAYEDCRKNKRNKWTTIEFETGLVSNLHRIFEQVRSCQWQPSGHMCFVVRSPKVREVWASPFADRIVHHLVYNKLRPRFEPGFIHATFACIPNRGTKAAADWAEKSAKKVTHSWAKKAYVLQADIANFFPTIRADHLCRTMLERSPEPWLAHLVREIILVDVKKNAFFPGDESLLRFVPKHKSLWHAPLGIGLPIGNLTSQFGANIYLSGIDHRFTQTSDVSRYGRYVDDIVMMDRCLNNLLRAKADLQEMLNNIGLTLSDEKTSIKPLSDGFDFCGRYIKPHRSYLRRSTVRRANKAMTRLSKSNHPAETVTSYLALGRHCNAYRLRRRWAGCATQIGYNVDCNFTKAFGSKTA